MALIYLIHSGLSGERKYDVRLFDGCGPGDEAGASIEAQERMNNGKDSFK
jgi:hypothetical protein